ncbi:MAG: hypothetical protein NTV22_07475 [bacterium]|nr:hypothetical protein [bacterium]
MLFHEPQFLVFLAGVCLLWLLVHRVNFLSKALLLAASGVFYATFGSRNCILLLLAGARTHRPRVRLLVATVAVLCNLAILCCFKYHDLVSKAAAALAPWHPSFLDWLLPVGMSFYILQSIAYIVDVYRTTCRACRNPLDVALLICFFPKLVLGPLVRPAEFLAQLASRRPLLLAHLADALPLFAMGLFKKVCLADTLATFVNPVFARPQGHSAADGALCLLAYSFQIYYDFSGCIDMVRAVALLLGYTLPPNFNAPYCATSVTDFWRRWHITLSLWLRDYLFLPLAFRLSALWQRPCYLGIRADSIVYSCAALVTMLVCGIWHGAGLTFAIWGAYHGAWLVIERFVYPRSTRPNYRLSLPVALLRWCCTFLVITAGWLVFRAASLNDIGLFAAMFRNLNGPLSMPQPCVLIVLGSVAWTLARLILPYLPAIPVLRAPILQFLLGIARGAGALLLLIFALVFACNATTPFIYFQF